MSFVAAAARSSCRPARVLQASRRAASTSTGQSAENAAAKAKDGAQQAADKAKEGVDKAKEGAQSAADSAKRYADSAAQQGQQVLSRVQDRVGGLLGSYREPVVYNLAVVREIGKQVYIAEKLAPPTDVAAIRGAFEESYKRAADPSWWRSVLESGDWKRLALYAAEAYGIFSIGEMIGRRHIVGYKNPDLGDAAAAHH